MEKCKIIFRPNVVPSAREQYLDLSRYFQEQGDLYLADFYMELAKNMWFYNSARMIRVIPANWKTIFEIRPIPKKGDMGG